MEESDVGSLVGIHCCVPFERLVFDGDVKPDLAIRVQFEKGVGDRELKDIQHCAVLDIALVNIESWLLPYPTRGVELYIDQSGSRQRNGQEFVLIPIRQRP
jgi:hypothetical protein